MAKYYFILILVMGGVLYYIFLEDPCNNMVKADFSEKFPGYEIMGAGAGEGSPENVQCHIYYQKPDNKQVYRDTWSYKKSDSGWSFSEVLEAQKAEPMP